MYVVLKKWNYLRALPLLFFVFFHFFEDALDDGHHERRGGRVRDPHRQEHRGEHEAEQKSV